MVNPYYHSCANGGLICIQMCQCLMAYGPTECSDDVTHFHIRQVDENWKYVPISGTLPNVKLYILDDALNPVPYGVIGELYVSGIVVGRGYINDLEKTNIAFIADVFFRRHITKNV